MAKAPEMSTDFARWYAESFMDEGATRARRWKGVVAVASKADFTVVEVLVRLAFPTSVPASGGKNEDLKDAHKTVVTAISGGDTSFDPARSARELQVLASAALVRLFTTMPDAAIAVTTASFGGMRAPDLPMELAAMAESALVVLAHRQHARTNEAALQSGTPKVDFAVSAQALQSMDPTLWKGEFDRLRDAINSTLSAAVEARNRGVSLLHRQMRLDEEELQMLWWLIGGFSRQLDRPFSGIEAKLKPLILSKELGDMTMISPGPASIRAMLVQTGVGDDELTVQEVVNAVEMDWAHEVSRSQRVSPVTTPLHFALEKRAELGSTDTWQAGWTGLTGLPADAALPAVQLAELFYREFLYLTVAD